jgi:hypothetical protein
MQNLFWCLSACLLAGCAGSTSSKPLPPEASLTAPCAAPVALPNRGLSDREVEVFWGRDRSALRACGGQLDGLAGWAAAITNEEEP